MRESLCLGEIVGADLRVASFVVRSRTRCFSNLGPHRVGSVSATVAPDRDEVERGAFVF